MDEHAILMRTNFKTAQKLKIIAAENQTSVNILLNDLAKKVIQEWEQNAD